MAPSSDKPTEVRPWNFRTLPCSFFGRGMCKHGIDCHFIHDETAQTNPSVRSICRFFEKGVCKLGDKCVFSHDLTAKAASEEMKADSEAHTTLLDLPRHVSSWNFKTLPCRFFPLGRCCKGDSCTYIHDKEAVSQEEPSDPALTAATTKRPTAAPGSNGATAEESDRATDAPMTSDESEDESEESVPGSGNSSLSLAKTPQTRHPRCHEYGPPPHWKPPPPPLLPQPCRLDEEDEDAEPQQPRKPPPWRSWYDVARDHSKDAEAPAGLDVLATASASRVTDNSCSLVQMQVWDGERWRNEVWDLESLEAERLEFESTKFDH